MCVCVCLYVSVCVCVSLCCVCVCCVCMCVCVLCVCHYIELCYRFFDSHGNYFSKERDEDQEDNWLTGVDWGQVSLPLDHVIYCYQQY